MIISIIKKKGGTGATPISFNLAVKTDSIILTNDDDVLEALHQDKAQMLDLAEIAKLDFSKLPNTIIDFGGYPATYAMDIVSKSDLVIVPTVNHISSLKRNISALEEITKHNNNVIVVATKTKKEEDLENVKRETAHLNIKAYFELKDTELFNNAMDMGLNIYDYLETAPVLKSAYGKRKNQRSKSILEQWEDLENYILKEVK